MRRYFICLYIYIYSPSTNTYDRLIFYFNDGKLPGRDT
jgi:hypothetical protein